MIKFNPESLRKIRKQRKISQADLALEANISDVHFSRIERGVFQLSNLATIGTLAEALNIPVDNLLTGFNVSNLSDDEKEMLHLHRGMNVADQERALEILRVLAL